MGQVHPSGVALPASNGSHISSCKNALACCRFTCFTFIAFITITCSAEKKLPLLFD